MTEDQTVTKLMEIAKMVGYGEIPPFQHDECFTIGAFDLIIPDRENRTKNFSLLSSICARYEEVKPDKRFLKGYICLLDRLAYATNTTEKPEGMGKIMEENPEETKSLREWYRKL
ncbi:MAG: hypothetical protein PVH19_07200 [Planctomycetia bacterium]|jgi:hypothetical protein